MTSIRCFKAIKGTQRHAYEFWFVFSVVGLRFLTKWAVRRKMKKSLSNCGIGLIVIEWNMNSRDCWSKGLYVILKELFQYILCTKENHGNLARMAGHWHRTWHRTAEDVGSRFLGLNNLFYFWRLFSVEYSGKTINFGCIRYEFESRLFESPSWLSNWRDWELVWSLQVSQSSELDRVTRMCLVLFSV
jgi:hypothetical protein